MTDKTELERIKAVDKAYNSTFKEDSEVLKTDPQKMVKTVDEVFQSTFKKGLEYEKAILKVELLDRSIASLRKARSRCKNSEIEQEL